MDGDDQDSLFIEALKPYEGDDDDIVDARANSAWQYSIRHPETWSSTLAIVADSYEKGVSIERVFPAPGKSILPAFEARRVVQDASSFPLTVINVAEGTLAEQTGSRVIPVGSVAARDEWFEDH